jgi:hypothetical protein
MLEKHHDATATEARYAWMLHKERSLRWLRSLAQVWLVIWPVMVMVPSEA